ncbi:hypothetical protein ACEQPO_16305 [Bacillus sp. SL00103]
MQDFKTKVNEYMDELHMQMRLTDNEKMALLSSAEGPMMTNAFLIMLLRLLAIRIRLWFINWQK